MLQKDRLKLNKLLSIITVNVIVFLCAKSLNAQISLTLYGMDLERQLTVINDSMSIERVITGMIVENVLFAVQLPKTDKIDSCELVVWYNKTVETYPMLVDCENDSLRFLYQTIDYDIILLHDKRISYQLLVYNGDKCNAIPLIFKEHQNISGIGYEDILLCPR